MLTVGVTHIFWIIGAIEAFISYWHMPKSAVRPPFTRYLWLPATWNSYINEALGYTICLFCFLPLLHSGIHYGDIYSNALDKFSLFHKMTSCSAPRYRRRQRRQSREVNEKLPIETYLYRCDPYRSSTVQDPWPYGIKVLAHPAIQALILTYKGDIRDTFIEHGFPADGSGVKLNFAVRRVYPSGQRPSTILSIGIE